MFYAPIEFFGEMSYSNWACGEG